MDCWQRSLLFGKQNPHFQCHPSLQDLPGSVVLRRSARGLCGIPRGFNSHQSKSSQAPLWIPISVAAPGRLEAGNEAAILHVFKRKVNRNGIPQEKLHQVKHESNAAEVALFGSWLLSVATYGLFADYTWGRDLYEEVWSCHHLNTSINLHLTWCLQCHALWTHCIMTKYSYQEAPTQIQSSP